MKKKKGSILSTEPQARKVLNAMNKGKKKATPKKPSKIKQGARTAKNPTTIKKKTKSQGRSELAKLRAKQKSRAKAKAKKKG